MMHIHRIAVILLLAIVLAACSSTAERSDLVVAMGSRPIDDDTAAWRNCHFRIAWPEDTGPRWGVDLLLAHKVIGPLLEREGAGIYRWRFHRRANRDNAGHQFSFVYYTGSVQAQHIISGIEQNPWRRRLLDNGVLESTVCETADNVLRPGIADGSDSYWSMPVQRHWPAYIMGVSALWLGLIDETLASTPAPEASIEQTLAAYDEAHKAITLIWQNEAEHALLHHLNAIFGYEEMFIRF